MTPRVLLITPPSPAVLREDRCMVPARNPLMSPSLPPADLLYLAAVAERARCECRIEDYSGPGRTTVHLLDDVRAFQPEYLVVHAAAPTLEADLQACTAVKDLFPAVRIIAKGSYFLTYAVEAMEQYPGLDLVIRGEAEETFREIIGNADPARIDGLVWRSPRGIVRNPDRRPLDDLDTLPFPARHLIDNTRYVRPDTGRIQGVIKVSRGCPHGCFYCLATPTAGSKVRRRSPANILAEIRECVERYDIRDFLLWSDIFTDSKSWVADLCRTIIDSGIAITWSANTRVDTIDRETARLMRAAGCSLVSVGVESGNLDILRRMGKRTTPDQIRRSFRILRESGMEILAYYLIGLPWETRATAEDTIRLAVELDSDYASFFVATPFPGTAFYDYMIDQKLLSPATAGVSAMFQDAYYSAAVDGHHLNRKEIAALRRQAVRRFHARPRYILGRLQKVRSLRDLVTYTKAAIALLGRS